MELQPSTAPLPPFWAAVRRRHPDADLVVLPAEAPPPAAEPVDDDRVLATRALVAEAASRAAALLGVADEPGARIEYAAGPGTVAAHAEVMSTPADGRGALDALRDGLERDGWRVGPASGADRLAARRDDLGLRASYAAGPGTLLVEVDSRPIPVGAARARELVRR